MTVRCSRVAAVVALAGLLPFAAPAGPVVAAPQPTAAVCLFESPVEITPALVMAEAVEGTFRGVSAPLHCAGTYEGTLLAGTGSGRFTGAFRSGRPGGALPAGRCLFVSGTAAISGTLDAADGRVILLEATLTWVSVGPLAVGGGTAGSALVEAAGEFRPDPGHPGETCFVSPLSHAVLTGQAVLTG
ncbi:MAG: hypothetical protein ACRDKW_14805 [Actinomycetota bacterium]